MDKLWYGADYNPEQWPEATWAEDVRLMERAGVTVATVGVFAWARLEPHDGEFDFEWLDSVIDQLHAAGIRVDLATATASPPPWLIAAHPEILPVTVDGATLGGGSRQHYSPSSSTYRRYAARLVRTIAERYATHPAIEAWHINNELACHVLRDYGGESAESFRTWLTRRYGNIETLNSSWGTSFWAQHYNSFGEIQPPRATPTYVNPTQLLDFYRFSSDAWGEVLQAEADILREVAPSVPLTTNFMGFFPGANYWEWAKRVDFISDDHYIDPHDGEGHIKAAMTRDLMRSLGDGRPWVLMEQATSAVNWRDRNAAIPPEMHRTLSLQAVARGADGVMQFQWRQSVSGAEKFHSAMVPHSGENTRIFRETVQLGADLSQLRDVVGTRLDARVALLFDWNCWWAHDQRATPTRIDYLATVYDWYHQFWNRGILVDFVGDESDLSGYDIVVVAAAVTLSKRTTTRLNAFVEDGGQLVVTYMSGILDDDLHVSEGGYLGALRQSLGVEVEEFVPPNLQAESDHPDLEISGLGQGAVKSWGEIIRVKDAVVLSYFQGGMLDGYPAITTRVTGEGLAWYVGTDPANLGPIVEAIVTGVDGLSQIRNLPPGVEVIKRGDRVFYLNHGNTAVEFGGQHLGPHRSEVVSLLEE